jgi:hypothetical protein
VLTVITAVVALSASIIVSGCGDTASSDPEASSAAEPLPSDDDLEDAIEEACVVNGLGNKLCGYDAVSFCELIERNGDMDSDSDAACDEVAATIGFAEGLKSKN